MTRHDRRHAIMQALAEGPLTAAALAARLGVTERTIYRDMDHLRGAGFPVEGTPGAGYRLSAEVTLPPLNITRAELEALHLGLELIGDSGEPDLVAAAERLSARIDAVLGEERGERDFSFGYSPQAIPGVERGYALMPVFRAALRARQVLRITLRDGASFRGWPLRLDFWGRVWTAELWDEGAGQRRSLRLDQVAGMEALPEMFVDPPDG